MAWTRDVSTGLLRFVGVAEILGAVGVVLLRRTTSALGHVPRLPDARLPVNAGSS